MLLMSYWENKKNAAIATELSISVRTVETILYKVVKKLRGEIKKSKKQYVVFGFTVFMG